MEIPFLLFDKSNPGIKAEMLTAFEKVYDSQWYIMGESLLSFEKKYAAFSGVKYCSGVANGLDAIIISLKTLNIGPGDEVIVPSNTYIATWLAVSSVGAKPVPVEPLKDTYNIDPGLIESAITPATRAVIPVHLYGQACEMDKIMAVAAKHNLFVVEDNAQAHGALFNNKPTGSFGNINATSFYPGKNFGALGDGGAVTTDDHSLYEQANITRNYGSDKKYHNQVKGVNSRLDELQAAFLEVKLNYINDWNKERNRIAALYKEQLTGIGDIVLPAIAPGCTSVYHVFMIRTEKRNELQQHLLKMGINTLIHYPIPPHLQQAYKDSMYKRNDFPIAEHIAGTCLSLPIYPGLTNTQINYICDNIRLFY